MRLAKRIPPLPSGFYADEGTAAHAVAEFALSKGVDASTFVGTSIDAKERSIEVTDDMAEFVNVFVTYCRERMQEPQAVFWIEKRFTLAKLHPPEPMFGTSDFSVYLPALKQLEIVDLKYGQGVVVDAFENKQLLYYALGVLLEIETEGHVVDDVKITIVQPRASHPDGMIRSYTLPYLDVIGFANELLDAARATAQPDAALVPGKHCRFCPASGVCPAQYAQAQEVAMTEFSTIDSGNVLPAPETLTDEQFTAVLHKLPILEAFAAAVRAHAMRRLEQGEAVAGFKLVAKRANRSWVDETFTTEWLRGKGLKDDEIFVQKVKSPAQIEKLVGKKALPVEQTQKVSTGYTMVPESDSRPALALAAGDEFTALAPPNGNTLEPA